MSVRAGQVVAVETDGARAVAAVLDGGERLQLDGLVLAGGRFLGGGLTSASRPREPLVDATVFADGTPVERLVVRDLVRRARFTDQPVLRAGLLVDASWRPVDAFGVAPLANVVACGGLLAGLDTGLGSGGLGVVAWTAARAGRSVAALAARGAPE